MAQLHILHNGECKNVDLECSMMIARAEKILGVVLNGTTITLKKKYNDEYPVTGFHWQPATEAEKDFFIANQENICEAIRAIRKAFKTRDRDFSWTGKELFVLKKD